MSTEVAQLPQIEVLHRVMELPMVELALAKSASTYSRVKDSHQLVHWALSHAETSLTNATKQAIPLAAPIAKKFETPIQFVDHTLCLGLNKIEEKIPIVKEKPGQILENAYTLALQTVEPAVSRISYANTLIVTQAASLKEQSWNKINQLLGSYYGSIAVHGLDSTAAVADKLIDQYFPAIDVEEDKVPISAEEDQLLHTVQTVGRLSNKAARRVFANVTRNLKTVNKDDLKSYVSSIVAFLQLTQYLDMINDKVQAFTANSKEAPKTPKTPNTAGS